MNVCQAAFAFEFPEFVNGVFLARADHGNVLPDRRMKRKWSEGSEIGSQPVFT
jgi:hypothetical protein